MMQQENKDVVKRRIVNRLCLIKCKRDARNKLKMTRETGMKVKIVIMKKYDNTHCSTVRREK